MIEQSDDSEGRSASRPPLATASTPIQTPVSQLDTQDKQVDLQRSEARFRAIFNSVSDGILVHDPVTGTVLDCNHRACEIWGLSRAELLASGTRFLNVDEPNYTSERAMEFIRLAAAGEPQVVEWRLRSRKGHPVWVEARLQRANIVGETRVIVAVRDISDSKEAQQALVDREAQLRTLINAMPDIVCFKDGSGRWLEANDFDLDLFQLTGVDYRGKTDSELAEYSEFYREAFLTCEETDEEAWALGTTSRHDEIIPRPDGDDRVFDILKVPTFHEDGSRKGLVVIGRDITERKRADAERVALEEHKRQFYRDTIRSVTDGKLTICESSEIDEYVCKCQTRVSVEHPGDAKAARNAVMEVICRPEEDCGEFIVAVGEAISNALKHANAGMVFAGRSETEIWAAVTDVGDGIESMILPSAVLRRGFSTKPSLGMGFSIMMAATDRILLNTGPDGTTLLLIKSLRPDRTVFGYDLWDSSLDLSAM